MMKTWGEVSASRFFCASWIERMNLKMKVFRSPQRIRMKETEKIKRDNPLLKRRVKKQNSFQTYIFMTKTCMNGMKCRPLCLYVLLKDRKSQT